MKGSFRGIEVLSAASRRASSRRTCWAPPATRMVSGPELAGRLGLDDTWAYFSVRTGMARRPSPTSAASHARRRGPGSHAPVRSPAGRTDRRAAPRRPRRRRSRPAPKAERPRAAPRARAKAAARRRRRWLSRQSRGARRAADPAPHDVRARTLEHDARTAADRRRALAALPLLLRAAEIDRGRRGRP